MLETFRNNVSAHGTLAVMSSGGQSHQQHHGNYEVYRGSKAALNMFMRSFAARHDDARTLLLLARLGAHRHGRRRGATEH